jgi:adenylate cyclase
LRYLAERSGQLVTKDELFAAVWPEVVVSDLALVACIGELRRALEDTRRTPRFIETVHGRGYRFIASVTTTAQPVSSSTFQVSSSPPAPALPLPDKPSIVVLPFVNLSGDVEQDYFSDGLTEILTGDLSTISSLFVIARNSAFTYKGKAVKVQDVGREMGVRYVLEGGVLKAEDTVRITAQLIDATTGYHLWAERYDRPLQNILRLQDEIVQKIVTTLKLQLTLWEQGILVRKRTDNVNAYDYYLRGLASFFRFTKEACIQARQLFEQAIELDPHYAEAYASLGGIHQMAGFFQWSQEPHRDLERAVALAQQAVTLDDSLPVAHEILSIVYLSKRQYEQARVEAERTITLAPNSPRGYRTLGAVLNLTGQAEQAIGVLEQALRFDPRYPLPYQGPLGWAYLMTRQYDKAIAMQQKALSHNRNLLESHLILTISYSELGREEEARAEAAEVLRLSPTYSLDVVRQTWSYKDPADLERTLAALRKAGLK